jgi:hypothetical protein
MPRYRLYCLNSANRHMELVDHFGAKGDDVAIPLAESSRNHRHAELWRAYRVVKTWKSDERPR